MSRKQGTTWRAVVLGACLIPPNAYWIMQVEGVWDTGHSTCLSLMWHVVVNLLLVTSANAALRRVAPNHVLSSSELVTVYAMLALAGAIAGRDSFQVLLPVVTWPFRHATPENEWASLFLRLLPEWPTIRNEATLTALYEGDAALYKWAYLRSLWVPVAGWTIVAGVVAWVLLCLNIVLRKQWSDRERLSYPVIQLPLAITRGDRSVLGGKMFWLGVAIGASIDLLNGAHYLWPAISYLPVGYFDHDLGNYLTSKPWSAVGRVPVPLYPFAIALGFILPLDLAFSAWFFYVVRKLEQVLGSALGVSVLPGFPYRTQQSTGAWLTLCLVVVWLGRRHIADVISAVIKPVGDEALTYRRAVLGFAIGIAMLGLICVQMGMSVAVAVPFLGIWLLLSIAITRARAELGPPTHELVNMNASSLLLDVLGSRRIGARNLAVFPMLWWFAGRGYRDHMMPHQLESMKMASAVRGSPRKLGLAMIVAVVWGSLCAFWALLDVSFREGLGNIPIGHDSRVYRMLESQLTFPEGMDAGATVFVAVGAAVTVGLTVLRTRFLSWPLHPLGYALSMNFGIDYIWSCLVISSAIKFLVLRYGGLHAYRRALPLAFGVILGEYVVGASWSLLSVLLQQRMYDFYVG